MVEADPPDTDVVGEPDAQQGLHRGQDGEEAGLDSSSCSIEQLPLELLGKVFLHLTTKDLKVRCGITATKIGTL